MGLTKIQQVLAQIYIDSSLRENFFSDPRRVGEELGLSPEENLLLSQLSAKQVNIFAGSLKHKRLNEVEKLLQFTNKVLGKKFAKLFFQYAEKNNPNGIKKHK